MFKYFGVALVALAVALAVVPHFTDCQAHGSLITLTNGSKIPMKCHWTGIAEVGAAVPLAAVGVGMVFTRRKETMVTLGVIGVAVAAVALAFPNALIGTCQMASHPCNTVMKPALNGLGSVALVVAAGGLVLSWRSKKLE
jgi:hypothetical protein